MNKILFVCFALLLSPCAQAHSLFENVCRALIKNHNCSFNAEGVQSKKDTDVCYCVEVLVSDSDSDSEGIAAKAAGVQGKKESLPENVHSLLREVDQITVNDFKKIGEILTQACKEDGKIPSPPRESTKGVKTYRVYCEPTPAVHKGEPAKHKSEFDFINNHP